MHVDLQCTICSSLAAHAESSATDGYRAAMILHGGNDLGITHGCENRPHTDWIQLGDVVDDFVRERNFRASGKHERQAKQERKSETRGCKQHRDGLSCGPVSVRQARHERERNIQPRKIRAFKGTDPFAEPLSADCHRFVRHHQGAYPAGRCAVLVQQ